MLTSAGRWMRRQLINAVGYVCMPTRYLLKRIPLLLSVLQRLPARLLACTWRYQCVLLSSSRQPSRQLLQQHASWYQMQSGQSEIDNQRL